MIKTRQRIKYAALIPVFVIATFVAQFANVQLASAASLTWDGSTGDNKFSTAANWSTNTVPTTGDVVTFDSSIITTSEFISNDIPSLSLGGINYIGESATGQYSLLGNQTLTVTNSLTSTATRNGNPQSLNINMNVALGGNVTIQNVNFSIAQAATLNTNGYSINVAGQCVGLPTLLGSGAVTIGGASSVIQLANTSTSYTGNINITAGKVFATLGALGTTAGVTTVSNTGVLSLFDSNGGATWNEPFVFGGSGSIETQHSSFGCSGGAGNGTSTNTFAGPVTLNSDFLYSGDDNLVVTGTYNKNGHSFTLSPDAKGTLTTSDGVLKPAVTETFYNDNQPSESITVTDGDIAVLNGVRDIITVAIGGTLKGTGTARGIISATAGIVAPGYNSTGTLTATDGFVISRGIYQVDLKNAASGNFDQVIVSDPSQTGFAAVDIENGGTLEVSLFSGYDIKQGDSFKIIDNRQAVGNPLDGTLGAFDGLAEGAQFTVNGIVFSITYVGGDGNDVVITALNAGTDPAAPNTGAMQLVKGNPILVAGLGIATAAIMIAIATRRRANR